MAGVTRIVWRNPEAMPSLLMGSFTMRGNRFEHEAGTSAVLATSDLDIDALDPARKAAAASAFARLCHTLETPMQLIVQVRPFGQDGGIATGPHPTLDAPMRGYWRDRYIGGTKHSHRVYVALRATSPAALDSACMSTADRLSAVGVTSHRLDGRSLSDVALRDFDHNDCLTFWYEHASYLAFHGVFARGHALRRLPGHPVEAGWLAPLLNVQANCDIAIHLSPAALGDALGRLNRRLRDFSAHRMLEIERGALADIHVDIGLDSASALRERLARNLGRPLHLSVVATARGVSLDDLEAQSDALRVGFAAALIGAEVTHFRHASAYVSTMPLAVDALRAGKLVDSTAAATCIPWVDAGCSDPGGYRLGSAVRSGLPVRVAPFDTERHANPNIAVFAASGHGKSFAIGALVLEAAVAGVNSVIIDPEGEYRGVVDALGGSYLELAPGTDAAVNVFEGAADDPEEAVAAVVDLVAVLCGDRLNDVERAVVDAAARDALQRAQSEHRVPLLADCLPTLDAEARPIAMVVRRFCTGGLGALFNRPTSLAVDSGVCAISLRDMPPEHVPAATLIVARWLWDLVRRDRRRRHIVFDEVGALCVHRPLRELLVQLARRCRKYSASLVVATQNAQDLLGSDEGSVIATNCALVLLGGHRAAETIRMEQAFGLTERQRTLLETASRGEFLLIAGDRRVAMRIEVSEVHRDILLGVQQVQKPLDSGDGDSQDMGAPDRPSPKMWDH
jgi:conjugal transfer ATP-binding protein TraC